MRAWNGWGSGQYAMDLPENGQSFLAERIGAGHVIPDATLESVCAQVPVSRLEQLDLSGLSSQALIKTDPETRVRHARGQSLPDWLAMRSGDFGLFPDAVAFPETSDEVAELLQLARSEERRVGKVCTSRETRRLGSIQTSSTRGVLSETCRL